MDKNILYIFVNVDFMFKIIYFHFLLFSFNEKCEIISGLDQSSSKGTVHANV